MTEYDEENANRDHQNQTDRQKDGGAQGFLAGILTCALCFPLLWIPKYCCEGICGRLFGSVGKFYQPWKWGQTDVDNDYHAHHDPPHHHGPGRGDHGPGRGRGDHGPGRGRGHDHHGPGRGRGRGHP